MLPPRQSKMCSANWRADCSTHSDSVHWSFLVIIVCRYSPNNWQGTLNIKGALSRCLLHYVLKWCQLRVLIHYWTSEITCEWQNHSFLSNKCLRSIISKVTNNSNEFWKTVRLTCFQIQLNVSTADTLEQKKMAVVERFKQESMNGLSAKKSDRCGELAVSGGSTVPRL